MTPIVIIGALNECINLLQWTWSAISSLRSWWSGSQEQSPQGQNIKDHVLNLQSNLQCLRDALPAMYDLINRAEWRSHDTSVEKLLPGLKHAVYEIEDILDESRWYELKAQVAGDESQSPYIEFFDTVIKGGFNKLSDVQSRLNHLSSQLEIVGLREVPQRFDRLVRPETTSLPNETKIFGRDNVLKQVMEFLKVPSNQKRKREASSISASTNTSANNQFSDESRVSSPQVLPIVGLGGVGKTTLAQHICSHQRVKSHFEQIIWICVSDDFDVKRLTKEAIQSCNGKEATTDNLDSLQHALFKHVKNKRLLIVLDDMWDDALKENGQSWKRFCAPFRSVQEGSMMLVTTRCPKVTERVRTMEPVILEGLKDADFWNFFKLCVFGSESSENDPELELIGRRILPKLKDSPLAAKTLGRMLRMDLQASHWNSILESELWELRQEETEILPALQLSYMYLPFYLKRCFSFCAVYPKDYKFEKARLAEIWVAEGFVEPQGGVPIQDIACHYFEDLVTRSFFQKVSGGYVIHDLLHDMAQKVSKHDCFILRNESDFDKVPQDVRHLYVLPSSDFNVSNLLRLCKYTKLRTLICKKSLGKGTHSVMDHWCRDLLHMRVISCASADELPDNIGNWKHLRYLEVSRDCPLKRIPSSFCCLYNLQILYAKKCKLESLPSEFGNLISLQKLESGGLEYCAGSRMHLDVSDRQVQGKIRLLKNLKQFCGHLDITDVGRLSKDHASELELNNKKYLDELKLNVYFPGFAPIPIPNCQIIPGDFVEVLQVLQPPISLKSLFLQNYASVSLPSWFRPTNLPSLKSLTFKCCDGLESISFSMDSQRINLNETPAAVLADNNNDSIGIFRSLTDLTIDRCQNLSSIEHFLRPKYVPVIKTIRIYDCERLASFPTETFADLHFLEEMDLRRCPGISSRMLVSPSLKKITLDSSGLFCSIECCSLVYFELSSCESVRSIQLHMWSLPALRELSIVWVSITSIGGSTGSIGAFLSLNVLSISNCHKLSTLDDLLTPECLPAIEEISVNHCLELQSLPGERFGSFPHLKKLSVSWCYNLSWQRGLVLPSSLQSLVLERCGDISSCVPSCLQNLTSLVSLSMVGCQGITSIPADIWRSNLASLEKLEIVECADLVSFGGAKAVAEIKDVRIYGCHNLNRANRIKRRGRAGYMC